MKKIIITMSLLFLCCGVVFAETTCYDSIKTDCAESSDTAKDFLLCVQTKYPQCIQECIYTCTTDCVEEMDWETCKDNCLINCK